MAYRFIFSQMFDVRPRTEKGELDLEKIRKIQRILDLRQKEILQELAGEVSDYEKSRVINLTGLFKKEVTGKIEPAKEQSSRAMVNPLPIFYTLEDQDSILENTFPERDELLQKLEQIAQLEAKLSLERPTFQRPEEEKELVEEFIEELPACAGRPEQKEDKIFEVQEQEVVPPLVAPEIEEAPPAELVFREQPEVIAESIQPEVRPVNFWFKPLLGFGVLSLLISLVVPGLGLVKKGLAVKTNVLSSTLQAYKNFYSASEAISQADISGARISFENAWQNFLSANNEIEKLGSGIISILEAMPGGSEVSSGRNLVKIGEDLALAGKNLAEASENLVGVGPGEIINRSSVYPTKKLAKVRDLLNEARDALGEADLSFKEVKITSLPENIQQQVFLVKDKLPAVIKILDSSVSWTDYIIEILGGQKAKKYLLVFENNSEMRPTGGFIGTYGLLDLDQGEIKNLFVGGIFDIDGQLHDKIIPPQPIQKISTAWSTHDANWFADFPTSAKKITWFFEKTGGPTVDGVIALTPAIVEKLLKIVGPIPMSSYGVTLSAENFVEVTQYKVEVDYDKEENEPKKILADFTPLLLDKISQLSLKDMPKVFEALSNALSEKQILLYFIDQDLQQLMEAQGWAGKIEEAPRDYLNVINTNISGYKTDKVIEQKITHQVDIQDNGEIIDTVTIVRHHRGGEEKYEWWNQVNSDYLRVYVPLGSELISASGHTLQGYVSPIDYNAQGFKSDPDVLAQENSLTIDPVSGTHIFRESGKTVFGNWVYTSPGESAAVVYKYKLPFRLDLKKVGQDFSILIQKQAGMVNSSLAAEINLPKNIEVSWHYPLQMVLGNQSLKFQGEFNSDKFLGFILNLKK